MIANQVQELYNTGSIRNGLNVAKQYISKYGELNGESPYLIYLMAKGLFALKRYHEAYYWANRTKADPENLIVLQERIKGCLEKC